MHGRRRWITAGIGLAAGLVLAPATASAAGLIAAYDYYVPGKGFEIGLKDAQTGAQPEPAGRRQHDRRRGPPGPLTGRPPHRLRRMRLLPGLNGDFVPPENRTLQRVDRQTGTITQVGTGPRSPARPSSGARITTTRCRHQLVLVRQPDRVLRRRALVRLEHLPIDGSNNTTGAHFFNASPVDTTGPDLIETTHGVVDGGPSESARPVDRLMLTLAYINRTTGALVKSVAHLGLNVPPNQPSLQTLKKEFGSAEAPASHPVTRAADQTVAFAMAARRQLRHPHDDTPQRRRVLGPEPDGRTGGGQHERHPQQMPAWSPDDLKLGFVRTAGAQAHAGGLRRHARGSRAWSTPRSTSAPTRPRRRPARSSRCGRPVAGRGGPGRPPAAGSDLQPGLPRGPAPAARRARVEAGRAEADRQDRERADQHRHLRRAGDPARARCSAARCRSCA